MYDYFICFLRGMIFEEIIVGGYNVVVDKRFVWYGGGGFIFWCGKDELDWFVFVVCFLKWVIFDIVGGDVYDGVFVVVI